jgi:hypothetical protein
MNKLYNWNIDLELDKIEYMIILKDDLGRIFVMRVYKPERNPEAKTRYGVIEVFHKDGYTIYPFYLSKNNAQLYSEIIHKMITTQQIKTFMSKREYQKYLEKEYKKIRKLASEL